MYSILTLLQYYCFQLRVLSSAQFSKGNKFPMIYLWLIYLQTNTCDVNSPHLSQELFFVALFSPYINFVHSSITLGSIVVWDQDFRLTLYKQDYVKHHFLFWVIKHPLPLSTHLTYLFYNMLCFSFHLDFCSLNPSIY